MALIRYKHSNGNTIDLAGVRYQFNIAGKGDTAEMPDEAATELLEGPNGHEYEEAQEETTAPTYAQPNPPMPANPPTTTFGPGPDSQFAAPTSPPASDGESKEG